MRVFMVLLTAPVVPAAAAVYRIRLYRRLCCADLRGDGHWPPLLRVNN